jgi:hypothetical protein
MVQRQLLGLGTGSSAAFKKLKKKEAWRVEYISTAVSNKLQA